MKTLVHVPGLWVGAWRGVHRPANLGTPLSFLLFLSFPHYSPQGRGKGRERLGWTRPRPAPPSGLRARKRGKNRPGPWTGL